jgi:hypothetical protein
MYFDIGILFLVAFARKMISLCFGHHFSFTIHTDNILFKFGTWLSSLYYGTKIAVFLWRVFSVSWIDCHNLFTLKCALILLLLCPSVFWLMFVNKVSLSWMAVFWVVLCSLVEVYQRFRGPCCLRHQGDDLWNVGKLLPDYMALQPRRQPSLYSPPWEPQIYFLFLFCGSQILLHINLC